MLYKGEEGIGGNVGSWEGQERAQDRKKVVEIYRDHHCLLPGMV